MKIIRGRPKSVEDFARDLGRITLAEPRIRGYVLFGMTDMGDAFVLHGGRSVPEADVMKELAEVLVEVAKQAADETAR